MDSDRVLAAFDAEVRRNVRPDGSGARIELRDRPETVAMVVAMAGDQPVCSARIDFLPGSSFASLWGGGTLPGWRGQGIYRALIACRGPGQHGPLRWRPGPR